jgi:hypothetical protein
MTESASAPAPAPVDSNTTPAASNLLKPLDAATTPTTPEQWEARRVDLIGDPKFRDAYMKGDPEAVARMKEVHAALNPKVDEATQEGRDYARRMAGLTYLKVKADLPDEVWDAVARNAPVPLHEHQKALQAKERFMRDKEMVRRYLDGDRDANTHLTTINLILAARVGDAEEVEKYRKAGVAFLAARK